MKEIIWTGIVPSKKVFHFRASCEYMHNGHFVCELMFDNYFAENDGIQVHNIVLFEIKQNKYGYWLY